MPIGDNIEFNKYIWRVLDIQDNAALIITENIIGQRAYHNIFADVTWADCELRSYLNGEFYDTFAEKNKSKIIPVINKNPDNPWYGAKGGEDTEDKIFLLTIEDVVCRYFGDSSERLKNRGEKEKYWYQKRDSNNYKRMATFGSYKWWWWLRSPGRINSVAAYIFGDDGGVGIHGNPVLFGKNSKNGGVILPFDGSINGGVRPALWLEL